MSSCVEQSVAATRELCRLFVPRFPVPRDFSSEDAEDNFRKWIRAVKWFAKWKGLKAVDRPCRVEATVRRWSPSWGAFASDWAIRRWATGVEDAMERSLVPAHLLGDVDVKFEALPEDTPLDERPILEGTQIILIEEEDL